MPAQLLNESFSRKPNRQLHTKRTRSAHQVGLSFEILGSEMALKAARPCSGRSGFWRSFHLSLFPRNQNWTGHILLCPNASCKLEVRRSLEPTAGRVMGQGLLQTEVLRKGLECSTRACRQYPSTCNGSRGARRFHKDLRDSTRIG